METDRRTTCACGYTVDPIPKWAASGGSEPQGRARQLAYYSAILPLGAIAASMVGSIFLKRPDREFRAEIAMAIMVIMGALLLASIVCGVIALAGVRRHGAKGIVARAVVGILFSASVLTWWVWSYFEFRE